MLPPVGTEHTTILSSGQEEPAQHARRAWRCGSLPAVRRPRRPTWVSGASCTPAAARAALAFPRSRSAAVAGREEPPGSADRCAGRQRGRAFDAPQRSSARSVAAGGRTGPPSGGTEIPRGIGCRGPAILRVSARLSWGTETGCFLYPPAPPASPRGAGGAPVPTPGQRDLSPEGRGPTGEGSVCFSKGARVR